MWVRLVFTGFTQEMVAIAEWVNVGVRFCLLW